MKATQLYRKHNGALAVRLIVRSVSSAVRRCWLGDAYKLLTKCGFLMGKCSLCRHQ